MKKVLWVSLAIPYDGVAHASGKIENYYLKGFKEKNSDVRLLSFGMEAEREKFDADKYGIEHDIKFYPDNISRVRRMIDIYKTSMKKIRKYKKEGYQPDVVVLEWTQMAFLIRKIKRLFPKTKFVIIEEDVTFLAYQRFYRYYKNIIKKLFYFIAYLLVKRIELDSIKLSDCTICNNEKDRNLLFKEGFTSEKVIRWTPFYQNLSGTPYKRKNNDIVFYGALGRQENYKSVIWFIENVFPLLEKYDVRFVVIGGGVSDELRKYSNDRIIFEGFVENLEPYFSSALCLAAPLVLGAGIKIKVLEAMSSGLPVITNDIGIEGVGATDGVNFIYAKEPQEYVDAIVSLLNDEAKGEMLSSNARKFMLENYNMETSLNDFYNVIMDL